MSRSIDSGKGLKCGPGLTKQGMKDDVNINNIVKKFLKSGQLPLNVFKAPGQNLDLGSAVDFKSAMDTVRAGERIFFGLSAVIRERFNNRPEQFLSFMGDGNNYDEAVKLGLVKPGKKGLPTEVKVVNPTPPAEPPKV